MDAAKAVGIRASTRVDLHAGGGAGPMGTRTPTGMDCAGAGTGGTTAVEARGARAARMGLLDLGGHPQRRRLRGAADPAARVPDLAVRRRGRSAGADTREGSDREPVRRAAGAVGEHGGRARVDRRRIDRHQQQLADQQGRGHETIPARHRPTVTDLDRQRHPVAVRRWSGADRHDRRHGLRWRRGGVRWQGGPLARRASESGGDRRTVRAGRRCAGRRPAQQHQRQRLRARDGRAGRHPVLRLAPEQRVRGTSG